MRTQQTACGGVADGHSRCRADGLPERLVLHFLPLQVVEKEYALVFCQGHMTTAHRPPFAWLRKAYAVFQVSCCSLPARESTTPNLIAFGVHQRKYKKNLKAAYIIHASTMVRVTLKLFKPFISNKFWKKLVYIDQVTDIYQVLK